MLKTRKQVHFFSSDVSYFQCKDVLWLERKHTLTHDFTAPRDESSHMPPRKRVSSAQTQPLCVPPRNTADWSVPGKTNRAPTLVRHLSDPAHTKAAIGGVNRFRLPLMFMQPTADRTRRPVCGVTSHIQRYSELMKRKTLLEKGVFKF